MDSYEQWTKGEIARLRSDAEKKSAAADTLQSTLNKWLESQGRDSETPRAEKVANHQGLNGHVAPKRGRRAGYGDKNTMAMKKIAEASPPGITTNELYDAFAEIFGTKYKRSSLRALLWHQKDLGNIERHGDRYVIANKGAGT